MFESLSDPNQLKQLMTWWRHQMETVSASLALCEGNPSDTGGFPSQRASNAGFDIFFDVSLNKRLKNRTKRQWFETSLRSLWRHCNGAKRNAIHTKALVLDIDQIENRLKHYTWYYKMNYDFQLYLYGPKCLQDHKRSLWHNVSRYPWRSCYVGFSSSSTGCHHATWFLDNVAPCHH